MKTLQEVDYEHAAKLLGVDIAAIKAVLEVETGNRGGFVAERKPTILFERSIFWDQLKLRGIGPKKYQKGNEDILYPKWIKTQYKGEIKEYDRLDRAVLIHREAALSSTRWGIAQITGLQYGACRCQSVGEFVEKMSESEGKQLELFTQLLITYHWDIFLRNLDWKRFALYYNGSGYAQNRYDQRLARAYAKYKND